MEIARAREPGDAKRERRHAHISISQVTRFLSRFFSKKLAWAAGLIMIVLISLPWKGYFR